MSTIIQDGVIQEAVFDLSPGAREIIYDEVRTDGESELYFYRGYLVAVNDISYKQEHRL